MLAAKIVADLEHAADGLVLDPLVFRGALEIGGRIGGRNGFSRAHPAFHGAHNVLTVGSDIPKAAYGHRSNGGLGHLGDEGKAAMDGRRLIIGANAGALGEYEDILAALKGMLGGTKTFDVGRAALDRNGPHTREGPGYELVFIEL